ncbi:MAG: NAD(P)H-hydrate epimerase [Sedimentisphaerales bacterium]|nr:NAD(P)H-hydrate epimerase [Sedimentisphaerales bacterium]
MERYLANKNYIVMSREEARAFDAWAINEVGIPGVVLMENAGRSCAELIKKEMDSRFRGNDKTAKVCIFCGTGNNGGDGYVIARHLLNDDFEIIVVICGERGKIKGDAKVNLDILEKLGQSALQLDINGDIARQVKAFTADADMIVDAIFGTGLSGRLSGEYKRLIEAINASGRAILAVDIPSGLDCDTGEPLGAAVKASWTVTFAAVKKGFTYAKAREYTGEVFVASIGVEPVK